MNTNTNMNVNTEPVPFFGFLSEILSLLMLNAPIVHFNSDYQFGHMEENNYVNGIVMG